MLSLRAVLLHVKHVHRNRFSTWHHRRFNKYENREMADGVLFFKKDRLNIFKNNIFLSESGNQTLVISFTV